MLNHVAIIPDGNRRWAKKHGVPALEGHRRGAEAIHNVVDYLISHQIEYLTVWGFSTDNWKRGENEVQNIFNLLGLWVEKDTPWLNERGVKLRHIGRLHELPLELQDVIMMAEDLTKQNLGLTLNLAFNYSGRAEIIDAINRLLDESVPRHIDEETFSRNLYAGVMPDVDLLIRTGGEFRSSDFMLWQTCYAEYFFSEVLWPDFSTGELEKALQAYSKRERRFGE